MGAQLIVLFWTLFRLILLFCRLVVMALNHSKPTPRKGSRKSKRSHRPRRAGVTSTFVSVSPLTWELDRNTRICQVSSLSNSATALNSTRLRSLSRHASYAFSGNRPLTGRTITCTFMSGGTEPPLGGSITTKKLPVPTSGLLQTSTIRGPILRFCIIGYGGPMCAQAGALPQIMMRAIARYMSRE
jgi:hypothetical protein